MPPEYMRVLLPSRDDGTPVAGHGVITAETSLDCWIFGVVMYELCSGPHGYLVVFSGI